VVHEQSHPAAARPIPPCQLRGDVVGERIELLETGLPGGPRDRGPAGPPANLLGEAQRDGLLGIGDGPGSRTRRMGEDLSGQR
jgi:hypothetical protein